MIDVDALNHFKTDSYGVKIREAALGEFLKEYPDAEHFIQKVFILGFNSAEQLMKKKVKTGGYIEGDIGYIPLTKGQVTMVDAADYEWLTQWNWQAQWNTSTRSFYAVRRYPKKHIGAKIVSMQRMILGLQDRDPRKGDHINCNTLDNKRKNLRIATNSQNLQNVRRISLNTSGYKGASYCKREGRWQSGIRLNGKSIHLGYHDTALDAHKAYCEAAKKYFGEFARLS